MRFSLWKKRWLVPLVIMLGIVILNLSAPQARGFFYSLFAPFENFFWNMGSGISDFGTGIFRAGQLKKENEELREENTILIQQIVDMQDINRENEELREALDTGLREEFEFIFADVIGKNIGTDTLQIRKGTRDGVRVGMPVVTSSKVAVGKVIEAAEHVSVIQLLS